MDPTGSQIVRMSQEKRSGHDREFPVIAKKSSVSFRHKCDLVEITNVAFLLRMFVMTEFMLEMENGNITERVYVKAGKIMQFRFLHRGWHKRPSLSSSVRQDG